jgi:hypothetical protein
LAPEEAIPPRPRPPRRARTPISILNALRNARSSLELAAESPCTARAYRSLRSAESVLGVATDLVDERRRREPADCGSWRDACACLIKGALDAVSRAGEEGADVAPVVTELARASRLMSAEAPTP